MIFYYYLSLVLLIYLNSFSICIWSNDISDKEILTKNRTYHWMQYFFANASTESTIIFLTKQISKIEANRYPIEIIRKKKSSYFVNCRRRGISFYRSYSVLCLINLYCNVHSMIHKYINFQEKEQKIKAQFSLINNKHAKYKICWL